MKLLCPKCGYPTNLDLSKSFSDDGEVFICQKCGYKFRYAEK